VAERERPDLVLMDVHIQGDVDGVATAGMLRAELGVPIVFLTANADDPTFRRALEVGCRRLPRAREHHRDADAQRGRRALCRQGRRPKLRDRRLVVYGVSIRN
jgi:CheY-like chemotaxis protein